MKKICFLFLCFMLLIPCVSAKTKDVTISNTTTTNTSNNVRTTTSDNINKVPTTTTTTNTTIPTTTVTTTQNESNQKEIIPDSKSAILIEASTGKIIYQKNAHDRYAPASMTKIMSMILIMESIEKGNLKWNDMLTTSEYAASMGGSQIFLQPNEKMKVEDLFKAVSIGSANDATVVFAEAIAGTEEKFVAKMNLKAKELGLKDTNFKNAVGLDEANHYSSAYDMAMMAKELVKHEKIFKYTTIYEDYLRQNTDNKFWLVNTNKLIKTYEGADGLKTGYTEEAGYCLTATAKKNSMRLIGTIMGVSDSKIRNTEMVTLLDYGYNTYQMQVEVKKGETVAVKNISKAKKEKVSIITKNDASVLLEKGEDKKDLNYEIKLFSFKLPIKQGMTVGILKLKDGNNIVSTVKLTVKSNVYKASIFQIYKRTLKSMLLGSV